MHPAYMCCFFHAIDYDHSSQSFMRQNKWTLKTNSGSGRQVAGVNLRLELRPAICLPRFSWEQLWGDHWLVTFYEPKLHFYKPYSISQSVSCYFLVCWLDGSQKHKKQKTLQQTGAQQFATNPKHSAQILDSQSQTIHEIWRSSCINAVNKAYSSILIKTHKQCKHHKQNQNTGAGQR